jgi:transmembrane sensor
MSDRETSGAIDDTAAQWAARVDRGPLSTEEQSALDAWLDADPRRLGAYARARAIDLQLDQARTFGADLAQFQDQEKPSPSRRGLIGIGATAAATVGAAAVLLRDKLGPLTDYRTRKGEIRVIPLADGSDLTLNTASEVTVRYSDSRRDIRLVNGEALFNVAKNPERPFVVQIDDMQVRAVGTSFTVGRRADGSLRVMVREGVVEVTRAGADHAPVRLVANTKLIASAGAPPKAAAIPPAEVTRDLAWREGMIAFENTSLADAAAEFARFSDTRIVIDDPEVSIRTVSGLFSANNPVGFASAVALSLDLAIAADARQVRLGPQPPSHQNS